MNTDIDNEIDRLIDNFELKPITKGLGFHHSIKEKNEIKIDLRKQSKALKNELELRMNQLNVQEKTPAKNKSVNMGDLAPFYQDTSLEKSKLEKTDTITFGDHEVSQIEEASMPLRFVAWFIDVAILTTLMITIFSGIIYFAQLPMNVLNMFMVSSDILVSFVVITSLFYIFYFSFFEMTNFSTPGKNILGMKVTSIKKRVTLMQSFSRSILAISSILLLGLPVLLKLHDKMTDTQIIKK